MTNQEQQVFGMSLAAIEQMLIARTKRGEAITMIVMSILSDAQDSMDIVGDWEASRKMINVAKYIIDEKLAR